MANKAEFEQLLSDLGYKGNELRGNEELEAYIRSFGFDPAGCSDKDLEKWAEVKDLEDAKARRELALQEEIERQLSLIPPRYKSISLDDFRDWMPKTVNDILDGTSMLIIGPNESGKTGLAWAVFRECVQKRQGTVRVVKAYNLLQHLKQECFAHNQPIDDVVKRTWGRVVDRLFIDELDKISGTDSDYELFFQLIDYRYEQCLQTVCLANAADLSSIRARIGQSTYSRLTGDGAKALQMQDKRFRRMEK